MADSPVQVIRREGTAQGQAQGVQPAPDDGRHWSDEVYVVTDRVITDVNDPLAVQVPEGVGASTSGHAGPLAEVYARGTPEDQFAPKSDESGSDTAPAEETTEEETSSDTAASSDAPAPTS